MLFRYKEDWFVGERKTPAYLRSKTTPQPCNVYFFKSSEPAVAAPFATAGFDPTEKMGTSPGGLEMWVTYRFSTPKPRLTAWQLVERRTRWLAVLGPGILFASTAIGVSHLVQSTRAGAIAGFGLLWAVVAANVAKYPFPSLAAVTPMRPVSPSWKGTARWAGLPLGRISPLLLVRAFVMGAVGIVTAAFLDNLFGISAATGFNATPRWPWRYSRWRPAY